MLTEVKTEKYMVAAEFADGLRRDVAETWTQEDAEWIVKCGEKDKPELKNWEVTNFICVSRIVVEPGIEVEHDDRMCPR